MKKILSKSPAAIAVLVALLFGCQNLDVQNENNPDEARALATPSDIESLIQGSFLSWYDAVQSSVPSMTLGVLSDTYTCSWCNFGMQPLSNEPRTEYVNETSYAWNVVDAAWFANYGAISAASDGIRNIEADVVDLGQDNARALAFGKLVQGLAHSYLSLLYDQGFILDDGSAADQPASITNAVVLKVVDAE